MYDREIASTFLCKQQQSAGVQSEVKLPRSFNRPSFNILSRGIAGDTVLLEGSMDGDTWETLVNLSAGGIFNVPIVTQYLRVNVTSWSAGNIDVLAFMQIPS